MDSFVCELVQRLRFFRSFDPLPADGRLLARSSTKEALIRKLRTYLHEVCAEAGIGKRIVPHQMRHTYASEMLRSGVEFFSVMKLLGHASPEMTMLYLDIALTDLQREFSFGPRPSAPSRAAAEHTGRLCPCRPGRGSGLPADRSTRGGNVPAQLARRCSTPLSGPTLQPPHQDPRNRAQTRPTRKIGRDWPDM